MKSKMLKSLFVIGLVAASLAVVGTQAAFTDTVLVENNTFTTGNLELKLFNDCWVDSDADGVLDTQQTTVSYDGDGGTLTSVPVGDVSAIVACPANNNIPAGDMATAGQWEVDALVYSAADHLGVGDIDDGATVNGSELYNYEGTGGVIGDWTNANGWYDALSSAQDWTNVYPGWASHTDAVSMLTADVTAAAGEGDYLSVGNAGTVPVNDVGMVITYEGQGDWEGYEPLDGQFDNVPPGGDGIGDTYVSGGDRIDPLDDADWVAVAGKTYDTNLANVIWVQIETVDATGARTVVARDTLANIVAGGSQSLGVNLDPDEVMVVRMNWEMDPAADNTYEDLQFDYHVEFTGTT